MALKAILASMVEECSGCCGVVVMGYDGIAIDESLRAGAGMDVQLLAVEYASVLKEIKRTAGVLQSGELEEISIVSERCSLIVRGLSEDFFAAMVLGPDGNFGKGRYLLRRDAVRIREELA